MHPLKTFHYRIPLSFIFLLLLLSASLIIRAQEPPLPLPGIISHAAPREITKTQTLIETKEGFGYHIRIDGDWMLTTVADMLNHGALAYFYHRDHTGFWSKHTMMPVGENNGTYIDMENNTAVVSVSGYDRDWGNLMVLTRDSQNNWSEPDVIWESSPVFDLDPSGQRLAVLGFYGGTMAYLFEPDSNGDWSYTNQSLPAPYASYDIGLEGNNLYIESHQRAEGELDDPFGVDIYDISGDDWTITQTLLPSNPDDVYSFGYGFEFQGDRAVISARSASNADPIGDAYLYTFERQNGVWTEIDILTFPDTRNVYPFRLKDDYLIIGNSAYEWSGEGSAVYEWNGTTWEPRPQFNGADEIDGNTLAMRRYTDAEQGQFQYPPKIDMYTISVGSVPTETPVPPTDEPALPTETPVTQPEAHLLVDGSFENGLNGWKVKLAAGDKIKCKETKIIAQDGICVLRFKGKTGEKSSVKHVITSGVVSGDTLSLSGFVKAKLKANGSIKSKVKLVVRYADESIPKDKIVVKVNNATGGAFVPFSIYQPDLSVNVAAAPAKIKFVIKNTGQNSKVDFDALRLEVE